MPPALVLGGGAEVWEDVRALEVLLGHPWEGVVLAANDIGVHWPRALDHWVTLHSVKMAAWRAQRAEKGYPNGYVTWANGHRCMRSIVPWPGGSSGMLAVQVALAVGCSRVVLCGVPMTATRHFAESTEDHIVAETGEWAHSVKHWRAWVREGARFDKVTRSMSGRTREVLGPPTVAWLLSEGT